MWTRGRFSWGYKEEEKMSAEMRGGERGWLARGRLG
jgi:hypothetical protein